MRSGGEFYALEQIKLIFTSFVQDSSIRRKEGNGFRSAIGRPAQFYNLFAQSCLLEWTQAITMLELLRVMAASFTRVSQNKMIFERRPPDFGGLLSCSSEDT